MPHVDWLGASAVGGDLVRAARLCHRHLATVRPGGQGGGPRAVAVHRQVGEHQRAGTTLARHGASLCRQQVTARFRRDGVLAEGAQGGLAQQQVGAVGQVGEAAAGRGVGGVRQRSSAPSMRKPQHGM